MKKPKLIILLAVLLLGLLIPIIHQNKTATNTNPVQEQKITASNSVEQNAPSPDKKESPGERGAGETETQADSKSGNSTSGNGQNGSAEPAAQDHSHSQSATVAAIAVVGSDGELLFGPSDIGLTPGEGQGVNVLNVLEATGLSYVMSHRFPDLVVSIAGQQNEGQSGWMFNVNNRYVSMAAGKKSVAPGDRIIWWYSKSLDAPSPDWDSLVNKKIQSGGR